MSRGEEEGEGREEDGLEEGEDLLHEAEGGQTPLGPTAPTLCLQLQTPMIT